MSVYILSEDADLDLDDIWEYIARDNLDAADRWIGKPLMHLKPSDRLRALATSEKILRTVHIVPSGGDLSHRFSSSIAVLANPLKLSP